MDRQPDRISVSLGQKINLGNYESRDLHYSYSTDVGEGETVAAAKDRAYSLVRSWLVEELERHNAAIKKRV